MNYCVYFKSSMMIERVTSTPLESNELSYIIISPEETENFLSGNWLLSSYFVILDSPLAYSGKLVDIRKFREKNNGVENKIYSIPKNDNTTNIKIYQDKTKKQCTIRIDDWTKQRINAGINNNFMVITACVIGDPHLPYFVWNLNLSDLVDKDVNITYTGTDNFEFFTKKLFDTYSHEYI